MPCAKKRRRPTFPLALVCAITASPAVAQDDLQSIRGEIQQMRKQYDAEMQTMRHDYEARLRNMEARLKSTEQSAAAAVSKAAAAAAPPVQQAQATPSEAPERAATGTSKGSDNAFNPAIGVVLDGKFRASSLDPGTYRVPGFILGDTANPGKRGLGIDESEVNFSANVDQALFANLTLSITPDNTISVEEGFLQTTALPYGLKLKAGRFFSGIGYLNEQHSHTWDFTDNPLPYKVMLNTQYDDDGVQMRWLAPTSTFLEFGSEVFRGDAFPAGGGKNAGLGAYSAFVHLGDDIGDSGSFSTGLSWLHTEARNRATGADLFNGRDDLAIFDAVYKWAPDGNPVERNFKLQGEYFYRHEAGALNGLALKGDHQTGWYVQGVYQFIPQWRVGLRYDEVAADNSGAAFAGTTLDPRGASPHRESAMVDYSTSEFGRFRLQYTLDESRPKTDHQVVMQYIISIGAHGAHSY
jgi:hypothetical protein